MMGEEYDLTEMYYCGYTNDGEYSVFDVDLFCIDLFVEYPAEFLPKFAEKIRNEKLSRDEIIRIIELVNLDNYVLKRALATGIHPITGCTWYKKQDASVVVARMIQKNDKRVAALENMLANKETIES